MPITSSNAVQRLLAFSRQLWQLIASFFVAWYHTIRLTLFVRSHPVVLSHHEVTAPAIVNTGKRRKGASIAEVIRKRCPSLYGPEAFFRPTWWLPGGNIQTVYCVIEQFLFGYRLPYARQLLSLPDGGTISLDAYPPFESKEDTTPILFCLHGLTGSSQEGYIRDLIRDGSALRPETGKPAFRTVVLNFRGCDLDTPVTTPRLYHAGEIDDTRSSLLWITQNYPKAPVYGIGFSMGANLLGYYVGIEGAKTPLKAAVLVSNPWDWVASADYIENGSWVNRFGYGPVLADALRTVLRNSRYAFVKDSRGVDVDKVLSKRYTTIRWQDDHATCPMFGFNDCWEYYRRSSSEQHVHNIQIPVLSLHTKDDPICLFENMAYDKAKKNPHVIMAHTYAGGHVAWFTRDKKDGKQIRWFSRVAREFVQAIEAVSYLYALSASSLNVVFSGFSHHDNQEEPACPRPAPTALKADLKGMVRSAEYPETVGFKPTTGEGLMTASRCYANAHAPIGAAT